MTTTHTKTYVRVSRHAFRRRARAAEQRLEAELFANGYTLRQAQSMVEVVQVGRGPFRWHVRLWSS